MAISDPSNALDVNALATVRRSVQSGDAGANHKVAQQFEGLFLSMMLKNMRSAMASGGPLDNQETQMATSMADNQLAQNLAAGRGIGLAAALEKQLNRAKIEPSADTGTTPLPLQRSSGPALPLRSATPGLPLKSSVEPTLRYGPAATRTSREPGDVHASFVDKYKDAAAAAAAASGIPSKLILGQAALESGWGKHEVRDAQGNGSYNLFGIKAGANWTGPTVEASTTEYVNGVAQKVVQKFRAYASYAESFMDYAKMIATSPRYSHVMEAAHDATSFATAMGRSGYATDPGYAQKLAQVLNGPLRDLA